MRPAAMRAMTRIARLMLASRRRGSYMHVMHGCYVYVNGIA
jgi:hypothetical protein